MRPARPVIPTPLDEHALEEMKRYAKEMWVYCSVSSKRYVDDLLTAHDPLEVLAIIERSLAEDLSPPPFLSKFDRVVGEDGLRNYDFERWFHSLQLIKLIPYVAKRAGSRTVDAAAHRIILGLLENSTDDVVMTFAASTLKDPRRAFALPQFFPTWTVDEHPLGLDFAFTLPEDYDELAVTREAKEALGALRESLLPTLREDPTATARIAAIIERKPDPQLRVYLLEAIQEMADKEHYALMYLRLVTDPALGPTVRTKAADLIRDMAHLPVVRDTFTSAIHASGPDARFTRAAFIRRLPVFYPSDKSYCDTLIAFVRNDKENEHIRTLSAIALLHYSAQGLELSDVRQTVQDYLAQKEERDDWMSFSMVAQEAAKLGRVELVPYFRELLARYENPGAGDALNERVFALRVWLSKLEPPR